MYKIYKKLGQVHGQTHGQIMEQKEKDDCSKIKEVHRSGAVSSFEMQSSVEIAHFLHVACENK